MEIMTSLPPPSYLMGISAASQPLAKMEGNVLHTVSLVYTDITDNLPVLFSVVVMVLGTDFSVFPGADDEVFGEDLLDGICLEI